MPEFKTVDFKMVECMIIEFKTVDFKMVECKIIEFKSWFQDYGMARMHYLMKKNEGNLIERLNRGNFVTFLRPKTVGTQFNSKVQSCGTYFLKRSSLSVSSLNKQMHFSDWAGVLSTKIPHPSLLLELFLTLWGSLPWHNLKKFEFLHDVFNCFNCCDCFCLYYNELLPIILFLGPVISWVCFPAESIAWLTFNNYDSYYYCLLLYDFNMQ